MGRAPDNSDTPPRTSAISGQPDRPVGNRFHCCSPLTPSLSVEVCVNACVGDEHCKARVGSTHVQTSLRVLLPPSRNRESDYPEWPSLTVPEGRSCVKCTVLSGLRSHFRVRSESCYTSFLLGG